MTIAILQALLAIGGCYGLWRLWRALAGHGRASLIIGAGFLLRAFGSLLLFWISWLRLPIARSLQLGDGLWFFAIDGQWYMGYARELLSRGPKAIVFVGTNYASRIFTQWLTLFTGAFGVVASTSILLNCFLYLAACGLILRIAARDERPRDFALAAIAFGPSAILWSLQPLKDTFFAFLIVAMVALWREWQKLWSGEVPHRARSIALCAFAMWYTVYAIAGTRWYVGAFVAAFSLPFLGLVANLPRPRLAGSMIAVVLFLALGHAFFTGGASDIPVLQRPAAQVRTTFHPQMQAQTAKLVLTNARRGFETTPGSTMINPGPALQKVVPSVAAPPSVATPSVVPSVVPVTKAPPPTPPKDAPTGPPVHKRKPRPKPNLNVPPETPQSLAGKIAIGAAAMFIPRVLAQAAGIVRIGGGRGFWLFADLDTVVFDFVVFFALAFSARAIIRRERRVTPLFILVLLLFAALTGPMIYTVANFGTLFRLREMIYVSAALLPLTLDLRTPALHINTNRS